MKYDKKTKILTIDDHGAYVNKNLDYFMIKAGENKTRFLASDIKKIVLLNSFSITKGAILLAMFNNVDIMSLSSHGSPLFSILPLRTESNMLKLLLKRIDVSDRKRVKMSKLFVKKAIKGKLSFLRYKKGIFKRIAPEKAKELEIAEKKLVDLLGEIKSVKGKWIDAKKQLLSIESRAANIYFSCFSLIFQKDVWCGRRDKKGNDLVNICLNYAYGVLKFHIFYDLIDKGVNPFNSIYHHQENKAKMFLVFDHMEGLRHTVCDKAVHSLINRKIIKNSDLDGDHLSLEKRVKIANLVLSFLLS